MNNDSRPDPDALLAQVNEEERQHKRGRLKIFLGYVAGVGKTYAMLAAAHQRKAEGVDVVVGCAETHRRAETEAMLAGLEVVPLKSVVHRGIALEEMDIDALLTRKPQLALVDELAHTNAPDSRHPKRYQDVEELLEAGIDVYTTLNIQHLESLNDIVAQITSIKVRETVPDRVIDEAYAIELIDLPPEELLQRLREGKVYIPEQASRAMDGFFKAGHLIALREIAMRRAAERVEDHMRAFMQSQDISGPWPTKERVLVCVSPSVLADKLVRAARRLADELNAEWFALYVEPPNSARLPIDAREQVLNSLQLAESLGARIATLPSNAIADTIIDFAVKHHITKIVLGKPVRHGWMERFRDTLTEQIVRKSRDIDLYIVTSEVQTNTSRYAPRVEPERSWKPYAQGFLLSVITTLLCVPMHFWISPTNLVMLYLLTVVVAAIRLGLRPAILTAFFSVVAFDVFFVPPQFTLVVADTEYILTFIGLFVVGTVISSLVASTKDQAKAAQRRESENAMLYALSRELSSAESIDTIIAVVLRGISETFGRHAVLFLSKDDRLNLTAATPGLLLSEHDRAVAVWTYEKGEPAGRGTSTLSATEMRFMPLKTSHGTLGALGVKPQEADDYLSPERRRLLETFANLAAQAIERAQLNQQASQLEVLQVTERLQTALLNSISHDLRTPLVSITGTLSSLRDQASQLNEQARQSLVETALGEAERLNQLVGNLLDMTRLESGGMQLRVEPCDIQDLIGSALAALTPRLLQRDIRIDLDPALPLIPMDFVLMRQVMVNLIDNSIKYSPNGSLIEVKASLLLREFQLEVVDQGIGIPEQDLQKVFDKFYRVQRTESITGTGLGLAICKGIVEAHGGKIWAEKANKGTRIILRLPLTR